MKRTLLCLPGIILLMFLPIDGHAVSYYSQLPVGSETIGSPAAYVSSVEFQPTTSDSGAWAADNFSFEQSSNITNIRWWGYDTFNPESPTPSFKFAFFADSGGNRGSLLFEETSNSFLSGDYGDGGVQQYTSSVSSTFIFHSETKYWLSIYSPTLNTGWGWIEAALQGDNAVHYFGTNPIDYPKDLAFELTYAPVPLPSAVWLLGSGLIALVMVGRRRSTR